MSFIAVLELLPRQAVQVRNPKAEQSFSNIHGYTKPMRELEAPIRFGLRAPTVYSTRFNEPITDNPRIANFTCAYWDEEGADLCFDDFKRHLLCRQRVAYTGRILHPKGHAYWSNLM